MVSRAYGTKAEVRRVSGRMAQPDLGLPDADRRVGGTVGDCGMNRRAVLAGALYLFVIGLGVYVLTLRTERDTARTEAQEARQDTATWKAAAQAGESVVGELAAAGEGHGGSRGGGAGRGNQGAYVGQGRTAAQAAGGNAA